MKYRSVVVCILLAAPAIAPGANKDIQELQRDIGLLQQQIRDLQKSQDEKFTAVLELAKQSIEAANKANSNVAAVTADIDRALRPLQQSLAAPIQGLTTNLRDTGNDVRALQQSVGDLGATLARIQQQLDDIKALVKAMPQQRPVVIERPDEIKKSEPPADAGAAYNQALSDYRGGKYDLAAQGFAEYLHWFPNEKLAPNAQFYIGLVHYNAGQYEQAVADFDAVLEHYVKNPKTEEALLYKGKSLVKLGRRNDGVQEFRQLLREYPKSDSAPAACEELKSLGMNCSVPGAARNTPSKRKKA